MERNKSLKTARKKKNNKNEFFHLSNYCASVNTAQKINIFFNWEIREKITKKTQNDNKNGPADTHSISTSNQ